MKLSKTHLLSSALQSPLNRLNSLQLSGLLDECVQGSGGIKEGGHRPLCCFMI